MNPLIQTVFHERPPFLPVKPDGFQLNGQTATSIDLIIHDFAFLRKLFSHRKMTCYSLDAITASNGKRCALCGWNFACTRIVRLMIMIHSLDPPTPAILDVADPSIPSISDIFDQVDPRDLHKTLITAAIQPHAKPLKINFTVRF